MDVDNDLSKYLKLGNSVENLLNDFLKDLIEGKKIIQFNIKIVETWKNIFN